MNKILRSFHDVLLNAINDNESNEDQELYTFLRLELITKLEILDTPDFLFGCESLSDFKKFINTLYILKREQTNYVDNLFINLYKKYSKNQSNRITINNTLSETGDIIAKNFTSNESDTKSTSSKISSILLALVSFIATIATIYSVYLQVKSNNPNISIINISTSHLTIPPRVAGLKANYYYRDTAVSDLWKLDIIIKNTGNETIIATGPHKNILPEQGLEVTIRKGYKILDVENQNKTIPSYVNEINDTTILIKFSQWRKSEFLKLGLYLESIGKDKPFPVARLDERQIIDGKVNYTSYESSTQNHKLSLVDYIPTFISSPLRFSLITIYSLVSLAIPIATLKELRKKENKAEKFGTIVAFILLFIISAGPLLWLVNKFW